MEGIGAFEELLEDIVLGDSAWTDLPGALCAGFDGASSGFIRVNPTAQHLSFSAFANRDPDYIKTYREHFVFKNVWNPIWERAPSGVALASEDIAPARLFRKTEFYNDWLRPQEDMEAGVGIRIDTGNGDIFYLALQYDPARHPHYTEEFKRFFEDLVPPLQRAVKLAGRLSAREQTLTAKAALTGRLDCVAAVVDARSGLIDANCAAEQAFSRDVPFRVRGRRLSLRGCRGAVSFEQAVAGMSNDVAGTPDELFAVVNGRLWLVGLMPVRLHGGPPTIAIIPAARSVLVVARCVDQPTGSAAIVARFARAHGLTRAEERLCGAMLEGSGVNELAEANKVTPNTIKTQLRSIFWKTGVNRQTALIRLILEFRF